MRLFLRVITLSLFLWLLSNNALSQQLNWALGTGGSSVDHATTVAKDNAGNVYIAGKFSGSNIDFDPSPAVSILSYAGGTDAFVAKYNAAGQFQWAFSFGGNSLDEIHGIAIDQNDNFFITGYFRGTNIDFDPGPAVANISSNGDAGADPGYGGDIFIAKYNSAGAYQWAFNIGGTDLYDAGIGISTDAAGNVYAGGYFTNTADFDPSAGTAILNSAISGSIFLAKYSNNGAYQWAFGLGSPVTNNALHDIKTDPAGNVYVTGYYQGTNIDFDPGPGVSPLNANGGYEVFVAKYNTNGQYQFAFSVGGPGWDVARGIGLDNTGNIYVIGDFNNTVDFDPGPGTASITTNGQGDAFLAKYSPAGQYLWAFGFGGTPNEYGSKVIIDDGHVFITGSFTGTADLDPSAAVENLTSAGGYDIYLGKYTLDGEYLCSFRVGGPADDGGYALASTAPNVFCLTGSFSGTNIDFDPTAATLNLSSAGAEDIFLTKYTWPDNVPPTGTLTGDVICSGQQAKLTFTATAGSGPFTIVYHNGTNDVTVTNVQSGVPFNIVPGPTVTTTYTLVSIRDASRCSETRPVSGVTANVIVNNCNVNCTFWPVFGSGNYSVPIPFSNNVSFSFSNASSLLPNTAYNTITPANWFTPNPAISTSSPPNATPHNPSDIGAIPIYPAVVNDVGTITFSSPTTTGFYLHLYQTVSRLDFDHSFALVSSDGDLHVGSSGALINNVIIPDVGPGQSPDDANATIFFPAGITQLKFTITSAPAVGFDGIKLAFTFPDNCTPCSDWLNLPSFQSYVSVGDLDVPGNQITVEAVFNRTTAYPGGPIGAGDLVSKHNTPSDVNYLLRPNTAEITTSNGYFRTPDICEIELNKTYHVAMVYNGVTLKFYRDGFLMSSVPATGNLFQNNFQTKIGLYDAIVNDENFIGFINEVRIWDVARTQTDIQSHMNVSLPNPAAQPGLRAYYIFDDLLNKQGNPAWNGTLGGTASINQTNPNCDFTPDSCSIGPPPPVVTANFTVPDTICVNTPVTITNTSVNATTSYWNFCVGNLNQDPTGTNMGNFAGAFSMPVFMDYVFDNGSYYGFITNYAPGKLARLNFGNSLLNVPTVTDLGDIGGIIPLLTEGVQVVKNEGKWYALIVAGYTPGGSTPRILKVDFGASITNNTPTATDWGNIGNLSQPVDLHVFQENGNWYGFTVNAENNTITRFNFTNSFDNTPTAINLGNVGNLAYPTGIYAINDNGYWRVFVVNAGNNSRTSGTFSLTRLDFGSSLLNTPTGTNLGNPGNFLKHPRDLTIMKFCGEIVGFAVNGLIGSDDIVRMDFHDDLSTTPTMSSLGNTGSLNFPHSIAKIFRVNADLYSFITNVGNNTLTRLKFTGCTNSSVPNSALQNPPGISYDAPGTYSINLTVDDGLPTQATICKQVVVQSCKDSIIINDYSEVLNFDLCQNALSVSDATAFKIGDTILLIQMKGTVIDSTNTASFGTITDYRNAGNYEFNYIKGINGNNIELLNRLERQYDFPDGKVQLVRVPYFTSHTISKQITCLPWDGGKGGVVAFNVRDTLSFSDVGIDVSGKGFRGGLDPFTSPTQSYCSENQFYYPPNPDLASGKGEGIANISIQKSFGRGAPANGGGGGNSHNSGGGGGSNGNSGGMGGYQWPGAPCDINVPFDNRGIGGYPLLYNNTTNKIFMGGGGGAGHSNNPEGFQARGGNGGGIIIISADRFEGTNAQLRANGADGSICTGPGNTCGEGMAGGGAGGTIVLNVNSYAGTFISDSKGGRGADVTVDMHGPGGGGSGGVTLLNAASLPANLSISTAGGANGVNTASANNPWGATAGQAGQHVFGLNLPVDIVPFKRNIDSVRIKDSVTGCSSFDFKGLGYTNTSPVASWQWFFGDGNTANVQNTSHFYTASGAFTVKLVVSDINGCKDSITKDVFPQAVNFDFNYKIDACNPLTVQFNAVGSDTQNPYWSFGDAITLAGTLNPLHTYGSENSYIIKYSAANGVCADTVTKTINLSIAPGDIIRTNDTTICLGASKQLLTNPALSFCWTPATYLNDPYSPGPVTNTPQNITYYYTAEVAGNNLITNGDFSQGNSGFTSAYIYNQTSGINVGVYNVGSDIPAWHPTMSPCDDHTTGTGNMMMINGDDQPGTIVWSQTITLLPNTNYAFSAWLQHITNINPASLQFSINGRVIGNIFQANNTSCIWDQFHTVWNSGNTTTAVISIVNQNLLGWGNDFALDDISFAPVFIKRDSVRITVDTPYVKTIDDVSRCQGIEVQLTATGAATYSWSPSSGLDNATSPNPMAAPANSMQYVVTGTTLNGCTDTDTVNFTVNPKPIITRSADDTICRNASISLFATGGGIYAWTPAASLNDSTSANPIATPLTNTTYYITVTDVNTCTNKDSVKISIYPDPVFGISQPVAICKNDSVQLIASGGNQFLWQPDPSLSNTTIANPLVAPLATTTYSVKITETACNNSATLNTTVTVNPLPAVQAGKSNDIDCTNDRSQLFATGAPSYEWSPAASLSNALIANPLATPSGKTTYIVKGTGSNGCVNYDSVTVEFLAINTSSYLMPNAFTPNNDGLNDCLTIRYWGVIQALEFSIYNRWGERIFFTNDPKGCWDGKYKGVSQDIGVYVYVIKAKTFCGDTFKKGTVVLIR